MPPSDPAGDHRRAGRRGGEVAVELRDLVFYDDDDTAALLLEATTSPTGCLS